MKKFLAFLFVFAVLAVPVLADSEGKSEVKVIVGGEILEVEEGDKAEIVEGRTFVPLRAIAEKLGAEVEWKEKTQGIMLSRNKTQTDLTIGSLSASITKGDKVSMEMLEAAPYIKNDRTYVPLRFIARGLGCGVYWSDDLKTAIISENYTTANGNFKRLLEEFFNKDLPQAVKTDMAVLAENIKENPQRVTAYFSNLWTENAIELAAEVFSEDEKKKYLSLSADENEQFEYLVETAKEYGIDMECPIKLCAVENNGNFALVLEAKALRTPDMATKIILLVRENKLEAIYF